MKTASAHHIALCFFLALSHGPSFSVLAGALPVAPAPETSVELCERTSRIFPHADLCKPGNQRITNSDSDLAPLIIQEVGLQAGSDAGPVGFGSLRLVASTLNLDFAAPAVYAIADSVDYNGKAHRRLMFLWLYPQTNHLFAVQGLRMTFNSSGEPAVWEALADPAGIDLVFVSRKLESAARELFGEPLPGRHLSVERSIREMPRLMVARTVEDGPVPMGPIIYLTAETHAVSTVTCRCSPVQAKRLRQTSTYELIDANAAKVEALLALAKRHIKTNLSFRPEPGSSDNSLERVLRLPPTF